MTSTSSDDFQRQIQELIAADRVKDAVDLAIRAHGATVFGYLARMARDEDVAQDAFQAFSLDLWRGLPNFEWRSAFRTWAFTLARRALYRQYDSAWQRRGQRLHTEEELQLRDRWSRTATAIWRKTQTRHWMWEVIDQFEREDREMMSMRLIDQLTWKEIAEVFAESDGEPATRADISRKAAALRKRYERLKEKIRQAKEERESDGGGD